MNTFVRYLVYGCIVFYIGSKSIVLKYILRLQGAHEGVVAHYCRPLLETFLVPIKEVLKKVDIEPRFLPLVPDHLKTRGMCKKAVEKYLWLLKYFCRSLCSTSTNKNMAS